MIDEEVENLRAMIAMTDDDRSSDINIHDTHNFIISMYGFNFFRFREIFRFVE